MGTTLRTSYIPPEGQENTPYPYLFGAFYERTLIDRRYGISGGSFLSINIAFDASRVSAIYGRSNTLNTLSRTCKFFIRYM